MSQDTVEGYVDHIIFRNEDNGYTVLNLIVKGSELTCVGTFEYVGEGELLEPGSRSDGRNPHPRKPDLPDTRGTGRCREQKKDCGIKKRAQAALPERMIAFRWGCFLCCREQRYI